MIGSNDGDERTPQQQDASAKPLQMLWLATVLLAVLVSIAGATLVLHEPADPPRVSRPPVTHRPTPTTPAAPTATAVPQGSLVEAQVQHIDTHYGGITLLIGGEHYLYHLSPTTQFPATCLQRTALRPGMLVFVVVPWYLSGDVYLGAVEPAHPCAGQVVPNTVVPNAEDSPPAP